MEQDIKILERMLKIEKECLHYDVSQDEIRAIEHLIKAYKELEEENKTLKNVVSEIFNSEDVTDTYIPVSLVEEKIEELNKQYEFYNSDKRKTKNIAKGYYIAIQKLQELLEKRK